MKDLDENKDVQDYMAMTAGMSQRDNECRTDNQTVWSNYRVRARPGTMEIGEQTDHRAAGSQARSGDMGQQPRTGTGDRITQSDSRVTQCCYAYDVILTGTYSFRSSL